MSITFHLPKEQTDYPYLSTRLDHVPAIGAAIRLTKSDNPDILPGVFAVTEIIYNMQIVNKRIATHDTTMVVLERVS